MKKSEYKVVGVMSGTSLDGIDLAYISFYFDENLKFKIHCAETISYSKLWQQKLKDLVLQDLYTLNLINIDYTAYLAEIINAFVKKYKIQDVDVICSHGHTALHQPEDGVTLQIGNLESLARLTNSVVVCDFRTQDVQLKGQGAPLVPIGDQLLFSKYDACVNLGGFANISMEINHERKAYDICPVNIVLNHYANRIGMEYDKNGQIAKTGVINNELLEALNDLEFYKKTPPKSLGLEWVNTQVLPLIGRFNLSERDILSTFVEHISIQVCNQLLLNSKVLFTGGGTFNDFLINRISYLKKLELVIPSETLINFKEALIFGLLGVLKLRNEVNCLSSVTGALYDHSSGQIYYP